MVKRDYNVIMGCKNFSICYSVSNSMNMTVRVGVC